MRSSGVIVACLVCGLVSGCHKDTRTTANERLDAELIKTLNNIGVENAIITQHTLYPYHFVVDGAQLNELGQRDAAVLARHFLDHPGLLNIRQGEGVSPELYQARVASVTTLLKQAGIEPGRVNVSDGMPGGTGLRAEKVVTILLKSAELSAPPATGGTITK